MSSQVKSKEHFLFVNSFLLGFILLPNMGYCDTQTLPSAEKAYTIEISAFKSANVGDVIGTVNFVSASGRVLSCATGGSSAARFYAKWRTDTTLSPATIAESGIDGIGIAVNMDYSFRNNVGGTCQGYGLSWASNFNVSNTLTGGLPPNQEQYYCPYPSLKTVTFYKTAITAKSGTYYLRDYSNSYVAMGCSSNLVDNLSIDIALTLTGATCDVEATTTSISLGDHSWADLRNNYSVGDNFGEGSTTLTLDCLENAKPAITFRDRSDSTSTTNTVQLTDQGQNGIAKGVGVQIFMGSSTTPQTLNTSVSLYDGAVPSDDTIITQSLTFKYIKTDTVVDGGKADAIVDLVFTYM